MKLHPYFISHTKVNYKCIRDIVCICSFCIHGFNQLKIKNITKSITKSSKKQSLKLPHTGNYSHSVYLVLTAIHIALNIVLCILTNLEMTKYKGGMSVICKHHAILYKGL